jgi:hypothetical protein
MVEERRGRPVAGWLVGVVTVGVVVLAGLSGLLFFFLGEPGAATVLVMAACLVLVFGGWSTRRVGAGSSGAAGLVRSASFGPQRLPSSAFSGMRWLVAEPGTGLTDLASGGATVWRVEAGTVVTEVQRQGGHILVTTPDGLSGWVVTDRLVPPGEVEGGP